MKKTAVAILAFVLIATGSIFIFAQKGEGNSGKRGHHGGKYGFFLRGLDLTDEQKNQVKQIIEASREKTKEVREQLRANHQKLEEITGNGAFDEARITELANNQAALHAQMIVEKSRVKSQIFAILTDEQKAKAAQMKEQMKEHFKNKMERFRGSFEDNNEE